MNKVILLGRLTKDPDVRNAGETSVAKYSLAVDRRFKRYGEQSADFINCIAFGRAAEFAEKYLRKGTKIAGEGRIQTGSYTNKDGQKVFTTDVVVEAQEFAESKGAETTRAPKQETKIKLNTDDFMSIPEDIDSELPFF